MIDAFITHLTQQGAAANTAASYRLDITQAERTLGDLREATTEDLESWLGTLDAKPATLARKVASLRAFYSWLTQATGQTHNPATALTPPRATRPVPKAITPDALERMLAVAPPRERALIALLSFAGLRISEALSVRPQDIDWPNGLVTVTGKGGKTRRVPLGRARGSLRKDLLPIGLGREHAWKLIRAIGQQVGVKVSPHALRHTCATDLTARGVSLPIVARILGHADVGTTTIYAETNPARLRRTYDQFHPRA